MHVVLQAEAQKRVDEARKKKEAELNEECTFVPDLSLTKSRNGDRSHLTFQRATATSFRATSKQPSTSGNLSSRGSRNHGPKQTRSTDKQLPHSGST